MQQTQMIRLSGSRGVGVCQAARGPRTLGTQRPRSELPPLFKASAEEDGAGTGVSREMVGKRIRKSALFRCLWWMRSCAV